MIRYAERRSSWDAEPQEDGGKVYRELLSGLKSCYGKPTDTAETKASDNNPTAVQTAIWKTEVYLGKLPYSENTDTRACRVLYIAGLENTTKKIFEPYQRDRTPAGYGGADGEYSLIRHRYNYFELNHSPAIQKRGTLHDALTLRRDSHGTAPFV